MKWLLVSACAFGQISCTTLANRRYLCSPEPAPDSREVMLRNTTTTTTTKTTTIKRLPDEGPPPDFR